MGSHPWAPTPLVQNPPLPLGQGSLHPASLQQGVWVCGQSTGRVEGGAGAPAKETGATGATATTNATDSTDSTDPPPHRFVGMPAGALNMGALRRPRPVVRDRRPGWRWAELGTLPTGALGHPPHCSAELHLRVLLQLEVLRPPALPLLPVTLPPLLPSGSSLRALDFSFAEERPS